MKEPLIVAPLDGSEVAERVLPYVSLFAKAMSGRVLLLTVWAGVFGGQNGGLARSMDGDWRGFSDRVRDHYIGYLEGLAVKLRRRRLDVTYKAVVGKDVGDPAGQILAVLRRQEPSLLVMATHGRSGLGRWWYGSVADRLVREAPAPTLVVGPGVLSARATVRPVRRILVPLDGSSRAEEALPHAVTLATSLGASITIAQAVVPFGSQWPFTDSQLDMDIDNDLVRDARQYLTGRSARLRTQRPVKTLVVRGQPAEALLALQEKRRFDLVVMTSHTRRGVSRAFLGSVTDRVIHGRAPVLVVRPGLTGKRRRR
jgi:nucleotide-binding universal stress UspA family protein